MIPIVKKTDNLAPELPGGPWQLVGYKLHVDDTNEVYPEFTWVHDPLGTLTDAVNGGAPQNLFYDNFEFLELPHHQAPPGVNVCRWMAVFVASVSFHYDLGANRDEHGTHTVTNIIWARKRSK